jgi:hypothetical protein
VQKHLPGTAYDPQPTIRLLGRLESVVINDNEQIFAAIYRSEALFSRVLQTLLMCIQSKPGTSPQHQFQYGRINAHSCTFL